MKLLLQSFAFFLFCQFSQAQAPGTSAGDGPDLFSNAERMSDSSGLLIQKEYVDVGLLSYTMQVVHFTDLLRRTSFSALRFSDAQNRQAFLDADEPIIKAGRALKPVVIGIKEDGHLICS